MIQLWPVGSEQELRFYFARRELTPAEQTAFENGGGLPSGIGYDPPKTAVEYVPPESSPVATEATIKDAVGIYHIVITVGLEQPGLWRWRGRAKNELGEPVASTGWQANRAG